MESQTPFTIESSPLVDFAGIGDRRYDPSKFKKPLPVAVPVPATLELILSAKNAGSLWSEQALGEVATLTGVPYFFERVVAKNGMAYMISVRP